MNKQLPCLLFTGQLCAVIPTTGWMAGVFLWGVVTGLGKRSVDLTHLTTIRTLKAVNRLGVSRVLNLLPSVTLVNVGIRNELVVYARRVALRQVRVLIGGLSVAVPYLAVGFPEPGRTAVDTLIPTTL